MEPCAGTRPPRARFQAPAKFLRSAPASPPRQRRSVILRHVLRAPGVMQGRVLGPDRCVVQSRRDRMRLRNLAVFILKHVGERALQNARERRR